ncbi:MAG: hypothetical protein GX162_03515 [Firmicutes bacterium]|nr:hypothetical protein [Bacillota bacterium]
MAMMRIRDNVEAEKPARGTVVATLDDIEAAELREIVILYEAVRMSHITLTLAKELAERKANWWETVCVKYGLPHTWPLAADYVEKVVYIRG